MLNVFVLILKMKGNSRCTLLTAISYRWIESYFPFTHPSWEMEIHYNDKWMELLGCGVMRHEILKEGNYFP